MNNNANAPGNAQAIPLLRLDPEQDYGLAGVSLRAKLVPGDQGPMVELWITCILGQPKVTVGLDGGNVDILEVPHRMIDSFPASDLIEKFKMMKEMQASKQPGLIVTS